MARLVSHPRVRLLSILYDIRAGGPLWERKPSQIYFRGYGPEKNDTKQSQRLGSLVSC